MTIMVRNDEHNIEVVYNNVRSVIHGAGMFMLTMESGETATFHYMDEDNSEWECFRIH